MNPIVIIPARLKSTRLPGKALADIAGRPMIVHVLEACARGRRRAGRGRDGFARDRAADGSRRRNGDRHDPRARLRQPTASAKRWRRSTRPASMTSSSICKATSLSWRKARSAPRSRCSPIRRSTSATLAAPARAGRGRRSKRRQARRQRNRAAPAFARSISREAPRPVATGRAKPHRPLRLSPRRAWSVRLACRPRRWNSAKRLEQLRALEAGMRIDAALLDKAGPSVDTKRDLDRAARRLRERTRNSDAIYRLSGRARREFRHRLPRRLSASDAASLRELRGRLRAVTEGAAALGMIPIENSIAGRVADIHHFLPHSGLHIVGGIFSADPFSL